MADYLDRPICPWLINYAESWSTEFAYESETRQVGDGAEVGIGTQTWTIRKTDMTATAWGGPQDIEAFLDEVKGRAHGFWVALANRQADILAIDCNDILCAGTELASRWGLTPRVHVALMDETGTTHYREVTDATAAGDDTALTIGGTMPTGIGTAWTVALAQYVRMASDDITFTQRTADSYSIEFSVVELPLEYGTAVTPTATIYLYEIGYAIGADENVQRFTSWGVNVLGTDDTVWTSRPIDHDDISEDMDGQETSLSVLTQDWTDCPILDMFPRPPGLPMIVRIYESEFDFDAFAETGTRELIFDGQVHAPSREGPEIKVKCKSGADLYTRELPRFVFSRSCQYGFCDVNCKLSRSSYEVTGTYDGASTSGGNYYIDVTSTGLTSHGVSWLTLGRVYTADYRNSVPSRNWEHRAILGATSLGSNVYRIQVRCPFSHIATGETLYLMAGCAKSPAACTAFGNLVNFGGHPFVPLSNPQTNLDTDVSSGKKGGK